MDLKSFISSLFSGLYNIENQMKYSFRFSQNELNDILQNAKADNLKFLQEVSKINKLSAFDISYLLGAVKLDENKVETIKAAVELYDEEEFSLVGQTFSDFIFRVTTNIEALNTSNLEFFKELVQCRNEIYDFRDMLRKPARSLKSNKKELAFAFEKILV